MAKNGDLNLAIDTKFVLDSGGTDSRRASRLSSYLASLQRS